MPPTPGTAVDTATPSIPVLAQRAEIENVFTSSMMLFLGNGLEGRNGRSSAGRVGERHQSMRACISRLRLEDLFDRTRLNDFSAPHDSNIVGDDTNDAEIVTYENTSEPELSVDLLEQGEDLRL
jgi:hypothetical protein